MSLNIECNLHYQRIFRFIEVHQPEIICMQEVLEEDFEFLKKEFGCEGVFKPVGYVHASYERYKNIHTKRYGIAIFSKKIIASGHFFYWGNEENLRVPFKDFMSERNERRSYPAVWVDIEATDGEVYRCVTTHFPVTENGESTPHQLEILPPFFEGLDILKDIIICGDFNAPRGNQTFTELALRYRDVVPKEYLTSIDQNLHRVKGIMLMVDGLFVTKKYTASNVRLIDGLSDHMAIWADIMVS